MTLQPGHLTAAQIEEYLTRSAGVTLNEQQQWIDLHLSECGPCLELALQAQRAQLGFLEGLPVSLERRPGCPDEDVIMGLASGEAPENAREVIHHIAECAFCGRLLRHCKEEFSQDFTAAEEKFLSKLTTSGKQWQLKFVHNRTPVDSPGVITRLLATIRQVMSPKAWRWAATGTAVIAIGVFLPIEGPVILDRMAIAKAKKLAILASSQPDQPTIEMRLPNALYAPYRREMGAPEMGASSPALKSAPWYEASAMVASARKKNAGKLDRGWLQVEGLTSLLEGTPGSASRASIAFEKALSEGLDDPSLEIELAASYFESDHPDVPRTIDLLEGILKRPKLSQEEKKVALFDLAIAYESIHAWKPAVDKWEEYLALDNAGDWAQEAVTRRDKAKSRIPMLKKPDSSPSSFIQLPALQSRVEEYQEIALESWLPRGIQEPQSEAGQAVRQLAELLAAKHSDPFLKEMLRVASAAEVPALEALSQAVRANKTGLYSEAVAQAHKAAAIFAQHHNLPGELRANFEEVFALQQALESTTCDARAQLLEKKMPTGYRWLGAQLALVRATCLNLGEKPKEAEKELEKSQRIEDNHFPVLRLRIIGVGAGIVRLQNNQNNREKDNTAWVKAVEGLRRFDEGPYPWQRLYQFYSVLEQYAEKRHLLHAQQALLQQAISIQEAAPPEDESVIVKGALYGRLSTVCLTLKEDALAREASAKSNLLLARAAREPSADKYIVYVRTGLAEAQLRLGDPQMAALTLEPAMGLIAKISHEYIALDFHRVLGDSYRQLRRFDESASIYEAGIVIAERTLSSLTEEAARLKWITGADPIYRGLALVLLEQGKDADALWFWEWYGSRSTQTRLPPTEISKGSLQKEIFKPLSFSASEPRLIYAVFEDRLQIWTTNARTVRGSRVNIKQADLERKVNDFALECASRPANTNSREGQLAQYSMDELRKMGRSLGSLFLQPVLAELEATHTITVELDPRLSRLPIAALMLPNGHYFGQDYAVTNSPGWFRERDLRVLEAVGLNTPILLADGAPSQGSEALRDQDKVKDTVRGMFANVIFASAEQTSWVAASGELKNSQIFVFIGHGVSEGPSTALVYGKVLLSAKDFPPELLKRLRLAVLAACSSGTGGENPLQETGTLVHAFLSAGVPSVMVTRWNVDSASTAVLLGSFFTHLHDGESISQAMYHARNDCRNTRNNNYDYSHPYFWAGLDLVGRAN